MKELGTKVNVGPITLLNFMMNIEQPIGSFLIQAIISITRDTRTSGCSGLIGSIVPVVDLHRSNGSLSGGRKERCKVLPSKTFHQNDKAEQVMDVNRP